ncbi:uncharacterized protein EI90DRAFT_3287941 [Cantharellus anzutake]|uniref:uncharacterized protein n=1 Tax=Cantharellus anzutake TaxID=1750568 RepID=UPI001903B503|nr:uncharacterized protein EI90DRAFT_3287941 [Cantharellus anzutake]KAF8335438.1 hypothetical protein EI90DRAFT_3287941 [Cantharellus anzutake]
MNSRRCRRRGNTSEAMSTDITSMNVASLKALCKSRGITGYSKLTRQALLEKLGVSQPKSAFPTASQSSHKSASACAPEAHQPTPPSARIVTGFDDVTEHVSDVTTCSSVSVALPAVAQSGCGHVQDKGFIVPVMHPESRGAVGTFPSVPLVLPGDSSEHLCDRRRDVSNFAQPKASLVSIHDSIYSIQSQPTISNAGDSCQRRKRGPEDAMVASTSSKKPREAPEDLYASQLDLDPVTRCPNPLVTTTGMELSPTGVNGTVPGYATPEIVLDSSVISNTVLTSNMNSSFSGTDSSIGTKKGPLLLVSKPFVRHYPSPPKLPPAKPTSFAPQRKIPIAFPDAPYPLYHLDFPPASEPPLPKSLSVSPRISQRYITAQLAVILMGLSDSERGICILVSKAWRYAVYLSALSILQHRYAGDRLEEYLKPFRTSLSQLNLWPYLRYRQAEQASRRKAFNESFLGNQFLAGHLPIDCRLWCSPNNERQIVVAIRFLEARVWLSSKINDQRVVRWASSSIIDAQPHVAETETSNPDVWKIYVEHSTTGHTTQEVFYIFAETGEAIGHPPDDRFASRPQPEAAASMGRRSLMDMIRWTNVEDYEHGISRHWLRRMAKRELPGTNTLNEALLKVARRYILANVAGNRHTFESIHLMNTHGIPLHPAIAVVQTPARQYYILRDTGQEIGCEEAGGVYWCWLDVVRCQEDGVST